MRRGCKQMSLTLTNRLLRVTRLQAQEFAWVDLQTQLNQLALQLGRREKELTILDEVIVERQRVQDVKLSGRPV